MVLKMEDLVLESGAKILYHHTLSDVIMNGDSIRYAVFQSKSGLSAIESKKLCQEQTELREVGDGKK